jgi:predicted 3-demethylubiquinone-9 3-methyltransferase (glyoxalase superfamily)
MRLAMEKVSVTLWFDKDAEAAAAHYVKAVPGSKIIGVERYGKQGPGPEGTAMLVFVELAGRPFMLLNGGPLFTPNESVSMVIYAEDQKEVDFLWTHMSEGGSTSRCGWLKDRWGFSWQVVPKRFVELMTSSAPDAKSRVFAAMMQMTRFDIAALEKAAKG